MESASVPTAGTARPQAGTLHITTRFKRPLVGRSDIGLAFAHRDAEARGEVDGVPVLHVPARRPEAVVDPVAAICSGFWLTSGGMGSVLWTCPVNRPVSAGVGNDAHRGLAVQGSTVVTPVLRNPPAFRVTTASPREAAAAARKASGT